VRSRRAPPISQSPKRGSPGWSGENQIFTIRVPERAHRENSARIGHATRITPANKDAQREQAFALHAQGLSQVQIAARLGINKNTAQKYIRDERRRRSRDPQAKKVLDQIITSKWIRLDELWKRWNSIRGDGPMSQFAKVKLSKEMSRLENEFASLYGVELPETDGERILEDRARRMESLPPDSYPEVGAEVAIEEDIKELDRELEERLRESEQRKQERRSMPKYQ
jgi:transcriptional regulator with XRE-family HTH domain